MKHAIALLSAAVLVAAAQPHRHGHQHAHDEKRDANPSPVADVVVVPGPTEVAYVLNDQVISEDEVQEGIRNGTLVWAQGGGLSFSSAAAETLSSSYVTLPSTSSSVYVAPTTSSEAAYTQWSAPASTSSVAPTTSWSYSASSSSSSSESYSASASSSAAASSSSSSGSSSGSWSDSSSGVTADFPDGELACSHFPSDYGAVAVDWMGLGGWTGIQSPGSSVGGYSDIETVTSSTCDDGTCCTEGSFCSYACPAGYQKAQWPVLQGTTGQSVGGIQCVNGKLHLTNSALSKSLCMTGADQVTILIENKLLNNAAVCRTDYPGTEGETVPLDTQPGTTSNLTCPDADNYYSWEGGHTSAQYYVNPEGVSVEDACQWGSDANPWGNYAPLNLGVGYSSGAAWLAIFQNAPTTTAKLDYTVEIVGDNLSGTCRYSNGQYCSGDNYDSCSSSTGCTVSISEGTATFVFSNS
ncbi:hypothetical protein LTR08_002847 [Meristemomyces frigidus]|nr:hypothetical protein LTR08_002847 [Meristemomyces frigidus]